MTLDFELVSTLIGFERLMGSHTAENMTVVIMKVLRMYGIEDYINCITTDNASVNDAIFKELEFHLQSWSRHDGQIQCLAHFLNLAAQTVLTTLKSETREAEVVLEGWEESRCNDPMIGSYNNYHLGPNGIPRGNVTTLG